MQTVSSSSLDMQIAAMYVDFGSYALTIVVM